MTGPRPEDFPEWPELGPADEWRPHGLEKGAGREPAVEMRLMNRIHELEAEVVRLKQDRQDAQDSVRDWVKWYIRHHVVPPNQFEPDPNEEKADA